MAIQTFKNTSQYLDSILPHIFQVVDKSRLLEYLTKLL
jgi:hypothetical protein